MLEYIKSKPLKMRKEAQTLAEIHFQLQNTVAPDNLLPIRQRIRFLTGQSDFLEERLKEFVYKLIEELPEGNAFCHGDFHPGNIMKADNKNCIIDWFGATKGDILSDVAHSYLIMENVPKIPTVNWFQHNIMKLTGNILANQYLRAFRHLNHFNWAEFSKWLVVRAAERTFYGQPSEKQALVKFIEVCHRHWENDISAELWYKYI